MHQPTVDDINLKRLVLVKRVHQNAVGLATKPYTPFRAIMAVIGFDWAAETMLKAITLHFAPTRAPSDSFPGLLDQCDKLLSGSGHDTIPNRAHILAFHGTRNDVQHKGRLPGVQEVGDCWTHSRDFLEWATQSVFRIDYAKLRLAQLVHNTAVSGFLETAERDLEESRYDSAVDNAAAGLTLAMSKVRAYVVGDTPDFVNGIALLDQSELIVDYRAKEALRALEKTREAVLYLALGMDYTDHVRYWTLAPHVSFMGGSEPRFDYVGDRDPISSDNAEWLVGYCVSTVIEIENRVGDLEEPFGLEFP